MKELNKSKKQRRTWPLEIQSVLDRHITDHFDPKGKENRSLRKRRFIFQFNSELDELSATLENAEKLYSDCAAKPKTPVSHEPEGAPRTLSVMFPFSRLITRQVKSIEMRKRPVPEELKGKRVFISESKSINTKFAPSDTALKLSETFTKCPELVVGSVVCVESEYHTMQMVTQDVADAACLSLQGLEAMWRDGFKWVWWLKAGRDFLNGPTKTSMHATSGTSPVWTCTTQVPHC